VWRKVSTGVNAAFVAAAWLNSNVGVIVGQVRSVNSVIYTTKNGGLSFSSQKVSSSLIPVLNDISSVTLASGKAYFVAVSTTGDFFCSVDNGTTWSVSHTSANSLQVNKAIS